MKNQSKPNQNKAKQIKAGNARLAIEEGHRKIGDEREQGARERQR